MATPAESTAWKLGPLKVALAEMSSSGARSTTVQPKAVSRMPPRTSAWATNGSARASAATSPARVPG
jgi:hypothetical protein